ncbi:hypothetical protein B0I37DRAFT_73606 [Chaetomium sp. MPI-CAGE-AT-0009]|nr:hypothetical protein B0I37DRAFT_73606 [Chaetomium sp. MPI-CAGE-AT-0009]
MAQLNQLASGGVPIVDLEQTARTVIQALQVHGLPNLRIAIIGGLARIHYSPGKRFTHLKNTIGTRTDFTIGDDGELYHNRATPQGVVLTQVNFIARGSYPYIPTSALQLQHIDANQLPYIALQDLIAFKIHACYLRGRYNRAVDAGDAEALLQHANTRLTLTQEQRDAVESGIEAVIEERPLTERSWWEDRLGLP